MNLKVFVVLFCTTILLVSVHESFGQETADNAPTEQVKTPADEILNSEIVNVHNSDNGKSNDDDGGAHADEHHGDDITVEPDVEQIAHDHNANVEPTDIGTEQVETNAPPKATGRSGKYQYGEFLGELDYGPIGFDFGTTGEYGK